MNTPRDIPGSPGGFDGPGMNMKERLAHRHDLRPGKGIVMGCASCPWESRPWVLGCPDCFQLAVADYAAHGLAVHMGDALAAMARWSGGLG